MSKKASFTPSGFPSDLPSLSNDEGSAEGEQPTEKKTGRFTVRTQGFVPPKYESAEEREARVQAVREVEGTNSKSKIVRKTY